jgi:nucleoside phosphorylase
MMQQDFSCPNPEDDQLFKADYDHIDDEKNNCENCNKECLVRRKPRTTNAPAIHYGLININHRIIDVNGATREKLRQETGILCSAEGLRNMNDDFPWLIIRGICDYSDTHRNEKWRPYAAATAAAYAKELLEVIGTQ